MFMMSLLSSSLVISMTLVKLLRVLVMSFEAAGTECSTRHNIGKTS